MNKEIIKIADNNNTFYPTPVGLIQKMLVGIDFKQINTILEPSAGTGNIVDQMLNYIKNASYYCNLKTEIDCIEIDTTLRATLKGKGYRVVHDNFLTFDSHKQYDLIVMNPPFSEGDKHLLKAIELQSNGGAVVCLLNAETLKNPYSNYRKDLSNKLSELGATIEYVEDAFIDADRKTGVEIALIKLLIPKPERESEFFNRMRFAQKQQEAETPKDDNLIVADFVEAMVQQFKIETAAGLELINEYIAMKPYIMKNLKETGYDSPILELKVKDGRDLSINDYLYNTRYKYWYALFHSDKFVGRLTSNLQSEYRSEVSRMAEYEFSIFNILTIQEDMLSKVIKGIEDTILALFEEFSHKHHWYNETSKNIHYYNGWKTNKAYKINKKIIIPLNAWSDIWKAFQFKYDVGTKLSDVTKVLDYLDKGRTDSMNIGAFLEYAEKQKISSNIRLKYFNVTFYKKGTCHIEFTDLELLEKFNLYGSQRKGWLPPFYGKKAYQEMDDEEKELVSEFSGSAEAYQKICDKQDFYIVQDSQLLLGF